MPAEQERWAEAAIIERLYGTDAPHWVAERVAALALAGDEFGVQHFTGLAAKLDALITAAPRKNVQ